MEMEVITTARVKEGTFDKMRQFLKSYLKEGLQFKASTAYMEFCASGQAADDMGRPITQKDFAMYLRTEVLKKDGLLKRTAHGVYEKRMDPDDQGITFPRKNHIGGNSLDDEDPYLDSIPVSQKDANLDKLCEDATVLAARIRFAMQSLQKLGEVYPEHVLELASYRAGLMKNMDSVATGLSAMLAWCEDHSNEILVTEEVFAYLESDEYGMEFSQEMLHTANSDDEIREYLIGQHRAYAEKCMECEDQGHDWEEIADGENGLSELDCHRCGESMTLSW